MSNRDGSTNFQKPPRSGRSTAQSEGLSGVRSGRPPRLNSTASSQSSTFQYKVSNTDQQQTGVTRKRFTTTTSSLRGTKTFEKTLDKTNAAIPFPELRPHLMTVRNVFGQQQTSHHSDKADIVIQALRDGCPEAFRETFRLAWREPVLVDEITNEKFIVTERILTELSKLMRSAEELRRRSEWKEVYNIWKRVGEIFLQAKDTESALYYFGKAQEISKQSADVVLEARAYEDLGKVYTGLGRLEDAMKFHESQLSLADAHREEKETKEARKKLVSIYIKLAEKSLKRDLDKQPESEISKLDDDEEGTLGYEAIKFLEKGFRLSEQTGDLYLQALTAQKLGETYESLKDFNNAITYHKIFLEKSEKFGNLPGMAEAYKHLGNLCEFQNDNDSALEIYEYFVKSARDARELRMLGEACQHMGLLLNKMKQYGPAIAYLEKNFELAQESGDLDWINSSRVHLGFSKGDAALNGFVKLIQKDDVNQLIQWKDTKDPEIIELKIDRPSQLPFQEETEEKDLDYRGIEYYQNEYNLGYSEKNLSSNEIMEEIQQSEENLQENDKQETAEIIREDIDEDTESYNNESNVIAEELSGAEYRIRDDESIHSSDSNSSNSSKSSNKSNKSNTSNKSNKSIKSSKSEKSSKSSKSNKSSKSSSSSSDKHSEKLSQSDYSDEEREERIEIRDEENIQDETNEDEINEDEANDSDSEVDNEEYNEEQEDHGEQSDFEEIDEDRNPVSLEDYTKIEYPQEEHQENAEEEQYQEENYSNDADENNADENEADDVDAYDEDNQEEYQEEYQEDDDVVYEDETQDANEESDDDYDEGDENVEEEEYD